MIDPFFYHLDRLAGFDSGRAGKASHTPTCRFFTTKIGVGSGIAISLSSTDQYANVSVGVI